MKIMELLLLLACSLSLAAASCSQPYTVVSGDSCWSIYTSHGLSSDQFYAMNPPLSASNCPLSIGQVVCVGNSQGQSQSQGQGTACSQYGAVKSGDNCNSFIARYNPSMTLQQLYVLNPQINSGCSNLAVGQQLCYQGAPPTTSSFSSTSRPTTSSQTSRTSKPTPSTSVPPTVASSKSSASSSSASIPSSSSSSKIGGPMSSSTSGGIPTSSSAGPMPTAIQGMNLTNSLPFSCNTTYISTVNDTCGSIAANFSLSLNQLQVMNPNLACNNLQNATALCTRDGRAGCLAFTEIANGDTCASIAARAQIGLQALTAYNPDLDCTHLPSSIGVPLCTSLMVPPCASLSSSTYYVQPNDTCASIALSQNTTLDNIITLNPVADCSAVGVGAQKLCLQRDISVKLPDQVNYQLLGLLVNAFHSNDSTLVPKYETYLSAPSNVSAAAVMNELYPMFLTSGGQQTLSGLEATNHFIAGLETAYTGKTRADYCNITSAGAPTDVSRCFCGTSYPFLTCVAKMYQILNSKNATTSQPMHKRSPAGASLLSSRPKRSKRAKAAKREEPDCSLDQAFSFETAISANGASTSANTEKCFGCEVCAPIPGTILCFKVGAHCVPTSVPVSTTLG
ncbi:hypothetical protein PG997_008885 [Apiospora hydei]|uniref:LysM domain-containing protein n=1 Tax=Apiospora hydei TaxID=1337664 RepID=A0ABR1WDI0_9PEZI